MSDVKASEIIRPGSVVRATNGLEYLIIESDGFECTMQYVGEDVSPLIREKCTYPGMVYDVIEKVLKY